MCVKNGGKSQMAAGLMRHIAGDQAHVTSAGTQPGKHLNSESVSSLRAVGIDISSEAPQPVTDELVRAADLVVVLGGEASLHPVDGTLVETWHTVEPSTRGIEGAERMRLIRDDIKARVDELAARLGLALTP